jgi:hypothetical protein
MSEKSYVLKVLTVRIEHGPLAVNADAVKLFKLTCDPLPADGHLLIAVRKYRTYCPSAPVSRAIVPSGIDYCSRTCR